MTDWRDDCLEELARAECDLRARVEDLESERDAYQLIARQALHCVSDLTAKLQRARERHEYLLREYRSLREQVMRASIEQAA